MFKLEHVLVQKLLNLKFFNVDKLETALIDIKIKVKSGLYNIKKKFFKYELEQRVYIYFENY